MVPNGHIFFADPDKIPEKRCSMVTGQDLDIDPGLYDTDCTFETGYLCDRKIINYAF